MARAVGQHGLQCVTISRDYFQGLVADRQVAVRDDPQPVAVVLLSADFLELARDGPDYCGTEFLAMGVAW